MGCCCHKSKRRWPLFVILVAVAAVILFVWLGDAAGQTVTAPGGQATAVTNPMCPVLTDEAIDPEQWVEYEGQRVYFCCPKCKRKFQRDPEAYLANLPQFTVSPGASGVPSKGHDNTVESHADGSSGGEHIHAEATGDNALGVDDHDHTSHEHSGSASGLVRIIGWLGNFHPPATDFPIALLISAAIAELLSMVTRRPAFEAAAQFCVWLGALGAVGAVTLGWFYAGFRLADPDWIMTLHRWLGTAAGAWALVLLTLSIAAHHGGDRGRQWLPWYRVVLFSAAAMVAANGFFGGAMIYGLDHYAW